MLKTKAYVVPEQGAKLELREIELPPLTSTQVEIAMEACGLCHTDISMRDNLWGVSVYPMVPGHEGVGRVTSIGSEVKGLKTGDLVGVGWIRASCGQCESCDVGRENICLDGYQGTFLGYGAPWGKQDCRTFGCYAQTMRVEERFAFKIPANITPERAAPLMCAGGTLYEPICNYVKGGTRVGIRGVGGLGTLGIKLAKASGGVVTALSRSPAKRGGAMASGASSFVDTGDPMAVEAAQGTLDVLIDTTPANAPVGPLCDLLKFGGVYCRVGLPAVSDGAFDFNFVPLIFSQKTIAGSVVTGSARTKQLFRLASANKDFMEADDAKWTIVSMPFSEVNEAMDQVKTGTAEGWRIVLKW